MTICNLCPHKCGINRKTTLADATGDLGVCRCAEAPVLARAGLHFWEEPVISGTKGSGTVFFSGCNLHCCYCQNYAISTLNQGQEITVHRLREIYQELIKQGAHNINLVTPTPYTNAILTSLEQPLAVPVVYNTSGYETVATLKKLQGKIQIYLPDLKYSQEALAIKYSQAPHYFESATTAILEMYRQTGPYQLDDQGLMRSGVIIRHLLLPGQVENTKRVIDWLADTFKPGQVMFSLMHQYLPCGRASAFPELNRKVTQAEYEEAEAYLFATDIEDGFVQEEEAASNNFIPTFDGTGI